MKERIAHICSFLPRTRVFADIGCDHGYMTKYMLEEGLCERAYISDISAESLKKATALLSDFIAEGRCIPVVADGLEGIEERCDCVLIAGLGGEEIVGILERAYLPPRFLFQPMKNSEKLRRYLVGHGAKILRDDTFSEGTRRKYYDLISGCAEGGDVYTEREFRFGRDNLNGTSPYPFLLYAREELEKAEARLPLALKEGAREALEARKRELVEVIREVESTL